MQGLLRHKRLHVRELIADMTQPPHLLPQRLGLACPIEIPCQLAYIQIEGVVNPSPVLGFYGQIKVPSIPNCEANTSLLDERQQHPRLRGPNPLPHQSGRAGHFQKCGVHGRPLRRTIHRPDLPTSMGFSRPPAVPGVFP